MSCRRAHHRPGPGGLILYGTTLPISAQVFLTGQINRLAEQGAEVALVYGTDQPGPVPTIDSRVQQVPVRMSRDPDLLRDAVSLLRMVRLIRRLRPQSVAFTTPKMGLIGLLAALFCRVPRRVYLLLGLRFEGAAGWRRHLLVWLERLAMACATEIVSISHSNRQRALESNLTREDKILVLGEGGLGVDLARFHPPTLTQSAEARRRFGLPAAGPVVGFVGRLVPDKGIAELASVWNEVHRQHPDATLFVIGADESTHIGRGDLVRNLDALPRVIRTGPIHDPEVAFAAMDVLILLTKREGFGMVLIEAAACGVPAVSTRVSGTVDAVVDGVTGTLVEWGDVDAACSALTRYLEDDDLRDQHTQAGRRRAVDSFGSERVDKLWADHLGTPR